MDRLIPAVIARQDAPLAPARPISAPVLVPDAAHLARAAGISAAHMEIMNAEAEADARRESSRFSLSEASFVPEDSRWAVSAEPPPSSRTYEAPALRAAQADAASSLRDVPWSQRAVTGDAAYSRVVGRRTAAADAGDGVAPAGIRRLDYPSSYNGLIDGTYMEITKPRDGNNTRCRITVSPYGHYSRVKFFGLPGGTHERASIQLHDGNHCVNRDNHPPGVLNDLFDDVTISVEDGREMKVASVKIVLNGITIIDQQYGNRTIGTLPLKNDVLSGRKHYAFQSSRISNRVLAAAAGEVGKSWSPKYGCGWDWANGAPGWWCSEFVDWVLRRATNLTPPVDGINTDTLAKFFLGLSADGYDRERASRFVTPNETVRIYDCDYDDRRNPDSECFGRPPVFSGLNSKHTPWDDLGSAVRAGFYAKIKRGGHSTFFVKWVDGFDRRRPTNSFWGLGGNQGNRVQLSIFNVTTTGPWEAGNTNHIFWDSHASAFGQRGYPDGFGDTGDEPVPPAHIH